MLYRVFFGMFLTGTVLRSWGRLFILLMFLLPTLAQGMELVPQRVTDNVYALIGPTDGRSYENYALNANYGFIITEQGVILIDSGASRQGAKIIERAVNTVTTKNIRWVINTGAQDHRWLGNSYFLEKGAKIIALHRTVKTQQQYSEQHLSGLKGTLKDHLDGTVPRYAGSPETADSNSLMLGNLKIELYWFGDAHFPGDAMVWLPNQRILFSGDLIYVDRMLGVSRQSYVTSWHQAFNTAMKILQPAIIVPGHGSVCDMNKAIRDTGNYLDWLLTNIKPAAENWDGLDATVEKYGKEARWQYLDNYESLHGGNVNRSYVQFENEETGLSIRKE